MIRIETYEHHPALYREYDPAAPAVARAVGELIETAAPACRVEHVGSTAVPGLGGKGVIDLALIYPPGGLVAAREALDRLGFQHQRGRDPFPEERPMRVGAVLWKDTRYRIHVHVIAEESPEVADLLAFRDGLCRDAARREGYMQLKKEILANGVTDSLDYWNAKSLFFDVDRSDPAAPG